jgi:undecaprenyl-diphosphatase
MDILEAILLGVVQGATEFLPISSSGHLVLVPALFRLGEPSLNHIAIAHEGTLLAVLLYFRRDLWRIAHAFVDGLRQRQPLATVDARLGWFILVGTVPAAAAGVLLEAQFDAVFGTPVAAAVFLLVTAGLLLLGEARLTGTKPLSGMSWSDAIIIGLAQMLALLPGISRSGSTIVAGLARGLDRETAARYSFLLGVPAIAGAGLFALLDLLAAPDLSAQLPGLLASLLAAAVVGYLCIHFLLAWLKQRSLYVFAAYTASFGVLFLIVHWLR